LKARLGLLASAIHFLYKGLAWRSGEGKRSVRFENKPEGVDWFWFWYGFGVCDGKLLVEIALRHFGW
jgi:hypothetical protein